MKKLLKSKKALSPVVAAIILIAVTVAVSIAVAAWMGALTFTFTKTEELKITAMTFTGSGANITLTVKNVGTGKVTVADVKVNDVAKTFSGTLTYNAGDTGTIVITCAWTAGNKYKVAMISATGTAVAAYEDTA